MRLRPEGDRSEPSELSRRRDVAARPPVSAPKSLRRILFRAFKKIVFSTYTYLSLFLPFFSVACVSRFVFVFYKLPRT